MNFDLIMKNFNNSGFCNTGTMNSGDMNTGDYNIGLCNTGSRNEGNFNTGDFNIGNYNTGDFNLINNSTGVFCTKQKGIDFFDLPTNITIEQWHKSDAYKILCRIRTTKLINGYLKSIVIKNSINEFWTTLTTEEKAILKSMPNFNEFKFKKITGLI